MRQQVRQSSGPARERCHRRLPADDIRQFLKPVLDGHEVVESVNTLDHDKPLSGRIDVGDLGRAGCESRGVLLTFHKGGQAKDAQAAGLSPNGNSVAYPFGRINSWNGG